MKKTNNIFKLFHVAAFLLLIMISSCGEKQKEATEAEKTKEVIKENPVFFKLSLAQWSLHKEIRENGMDPLDFAQKASEMGFEGIEYVSQLYDDELKKERTQKLLWRICSKR